MSSRSRWSKLIININKAAILLNALVWYACPAKQKTATNNNHKQFINCRHYLLKLSKGCVIISHGSFLPFLEAINNSYLLLVFDMYMMGDYIMAVFIYIQSLFQCKKSYKRIIETTNFSQQNIDHNELHVKDFFELDKP